jgi:hypothetical protein
MLLPMSSPTDRRGVVHMHSDNGVSRMRPRRVLRRVGEKKSHRAGKIRNMFRRGQYILKIKNVWLELIIAASSLAIEDRRRAIAAMLNYRG